MNELRQLERQIVSNDYEGSEDPNNKEEKEFDSRPMDIDCIMRITKNFTKFLRKFDVSSQQSEISKLVFMTNV